MSENRRNYTKAIYGFDAVVKRTDPSTWGNPSPCEGWTAEDVLDHVVAVTNRFSGLVRGEEVAEASDDPVAKWAAARDSMLEALDGPGVLGRVSETPFGEMPIDELIGTATFDPLTHTWDLAEAVGVDAALDEGLVATIMARLEPMQAMLRETGRFGAAVDAAPDADIVSRYIAFTGRQAG